MSFCWASESFACLPLVMFFCCVLPFVEVVFSLADTGGVFMLYKIEAICSGIPSGCRRNHVFHRRKGAM